jgi:hypothetical protein
VEAAEAPRARQFLVSVRDLLDFGWCQNAEARDAMGRPVEPAGAAACSWSLLGALVAVTEPARLESGDLELADLTAALTPLAALIPSSSLAEWNDDPARAVGDVLRVVDDAIALLAAETAAAPPTRAAS